MLLNPILGSFSWHLAVLVPAVLVAGACLLSLLLIKRKQLRVRRMHETALAEAAAERERLRKENNRLNYDMIVLYQFVNNLAHCRSTGTVCQEFVTTVQQSIDPEVSGLFLLGPAQDNLWLAAHHGLDELEGRAHPVQAGKGLIGWVIANGREVLVEDVDLDPRFPELRQPPYAPRFRAAIGLPLLFQNRTLGVIIVGRSRGGFTQDELRLLFIIANEAALYVQNLRLYEEVATLAIRDGSTGLYNHRHFFVEIDRLLTECKNRSVRLTLLMIDIDNFKLFNDRYGHLTGDLILREVARLIQENVKPDHLVARYGGEEFAVLMPGVEAAQALEIAERIRRRVQEHPFATPDERQARVTISIGLATYPDHLLGTANAVTDLIAAADEQLVAHAKKNGRNRVCHP